MSNEMDWQKKAVAIDALSPIEIRLRKEGDWYILTRIDIEDDGAYISPCGDGRTPMEAIEDLWKNLTNLKKHQWVVVGACENKPRRFRWNGFMWQEKL